MVPFKQMQQPLRLVILSPFTGNIFVHLCKRRVYMDRAHNLFQAKAMFHGKDIFTDQVTGMLAGNGHPKDLVTSRPGQHLY